MCASIIILRIATQKSNAGSREGTPSRDGADNLSVDSGDILGEKTPPGSPSRRRKYPKLALTPAQQSQQEGGSGSNVPSGIIKTHMGEASEGGFFSDKFYQTFVERCYVNGL